MATISNEELKKQMAENSAAWHTADETEKKRLEEENKRLADQIGGMSFNSASGTWSSNSASGTWSSNGASSGSANTGTIPKADYSDYEPLNKNNYTGEGYEQAVKKQERAIIDNPLLGIGFNDKEYEELFGHLPEVVRTGYYTKDLTAAQAAKEKYGVNYTPTTYNGEDGWYLVDSAQREEKEGESSADAGILSDNDYAAVQYCKEQWANDDALYKQALAGGNTALAEEYKNRRDGWHVAAERIRANSGYSGGEDGSMHIDYRTEALAGNMIAANDRVADYVNQRGGNAQTLWDYYEKNGYPDSYVDYLKSLNEEDSSTLRDAGTQNARLEALGLIAPSGSSGGSGSSGSSGGSGSSGSSGGSGGTSGASGKPTAPQVTLPEIPEFKVPGVSEESDPSGQVTDYSDYIKEMIAAQQEADAAAFLEVYNKNVNVLDRAGAGLQEGFQDARNQTAGAADLANRNFAEFANASGLNSGTEGQAALSRSIGLQNNMNSINKQEAQSLADLQQQYADNEAWYNSAITEMKAQGKLQEAQMLYQEKIRVETAAIELMQQQLQNEITQYQLQYQALRDSVADAQWQQAFDMQYQQWLQDVEMQMAQLEMQKQSLELQAQQIGADLDQQDWENSFAMQQYYDKLAQNGYTPQNITGGLFGLGTGTPSAGTPVADTPPVSYNNGGLDSWQIKQMQLALGVDQDGYYGPQTQAAAGDTSASDLWYLLHHAGDTKDEEMLSESAWNWYKQYGDKVGYQSRGLQDFDNYQDYARDFLNFALASA